MKLLITHTFFPSHRRLNENKLINIIFRSRMKANDNKSIAMIYSSFLSSPGKMNQTRVLSRLRSDLKKRINYCYKRRKTRLNDSHEERKKMQLITLGNLSSYTVGSKTRRFSFFFPRQFCGNTIILHETTLETLRLMKTCDVNTKIVSFLPSSPCLK